MFQVKFIYYDKRLTDFRSSRINLFMAIIQNISIQIFRRKWLFLGLHSFISKK
jgi:hypothetical protein